MRRSQNGSLKQNFFRPRLTVSIPLMLASWGEFESINGRFTERTNYQSAAATEGRRGCQNQWDGRIIEEIRLKRQSFLLVSGLTRCCCRSTYCTHLVRGARDAAYRCGEAAGGDSEEVSLTMS